jgi:hypothetical protein
MPWDVAIFDRRMAVPRDFTSDIYFVQGNLLEVGVMGIKAFLCVGSEDVNGTCEIPCNKIQIIQKRTAVDCGSVCVCSNR